MEEARLFALPEGIVVVQIQITEHGLLIETTATAPTARCPACFEVSDSIHCHYRRMLRDVPCAGCQVQLLLTVRKFTCRNPACFRKVFAERLPDFVQPHARTTSRHTEQITSIGLATCGQGGARLAGRLGIHTSRHTILRHILALPDVSTGSVLWLGIDEFAFRRGYRFGTILVNLESHRVVDLLPNRDAASAATWMRQHPDLTVVSRDRGSEYARAASAGAAQALQCADRFHLVKNLTEITQLLLARCQAAILETSKTKVQQQDDPNRSPITIEEWRPKEPAYVKKTRLARRTGRYARYQRVIELHTQGLTPAEIASQLGLSARTVRSWLASDGFPEARKRRKKRSDFEAFAPFVLTRWQEGERNGIHLARELREQGYTGSERTVYRYLEALKQAEVNATTLNRLQKWSAKTAVWLFVRLPNVLDGLEREALAAFCQASPTLKRAYELIQAFLLLVHQREGANLDSWLAHVKESGISELQSFAAGIEKDKEAVKAGLSWSINNGMVEGHVTKLKLIKRQGYGRASFPLLRKRVLHAV